MLAAGEDNQQRRHPEPSEAVPTTPRVLTIISFVLEKLVARNERLSLDLSQQQQQQQQLNGGKRLSVFDGVRAPSISIAKYLERIYKYTNCSPSCFVVGYVYIDRLVHKHPDSLVVSINVHRLLVTSVMLASKMLDDVYVTLSLYIHIYIYP